MDNIIQEKNNTQKYSSSEKMKAAYALNLCTVSVSQIVDYHDSYILEQEYDAILNNLNLKEIPKDEALLKILSEILNTITFFRIQDIKKKQIEKKYQQRLNAAIWSAIPSLSVVVSNNPVAVALSLATQVGSAYMHYRREKASAKSDKEDAEIELQITAIEQLNALRRELFTTAWRLSDEYGFNDEWRLTEKQIRQYNEILMDTNDYRKYTRLESIADKFVAYPPFWYFYGHAANYIAESAKKRVAENKQNNDSIYKDMAIFKQYRELAKKHFEHYYSLISTNILREDQLTASFSLEYSDILLEEEVKNFDKIYNLLKLGERMAPNSFDILQLCSISYLKIGRTDDAARLLKILVNEDYNATSNTRLLSRLYVSKYITSSDQKAYTDYKLLEMQVDPLLLYPIPSSLSSTNVEETLDKKFIDKQKAILTMMYRRSLTAFANKEFEAFNSVLPAPDERLQKTGIYYQNTTRAKNYQMEIVKRTFDSRNRENYIARLRDCSFRAGYINVLNNTVISLEGLSCFRHLLNHDQLIHMIEARLRYSKKFMMEVQKKLDDGNFEYQDYTELVEKYSYAFFTEEFFYKLKIEIANVIDSISNTVFSKQLEKLDTELRVFCENHQLPSPDDYLPSYSFAKEESESQTITPFFDDKLLGDGEWNHQIVETRKDMARLVQKEIDALIINPSNIKIHLLDSNEFNSYLRNDRLRSKDQSLYQLRKTSFAIIDDLTKSDCDLIFCLEGIAIAKKNVIRDIVPYSDVKYASEKNTPMLRLGFSETYSNDKNIDIMSLDSLIMELSKYDMKGV